MGKPKKDSGTWLMTYGDLVTLLLVFFVLLYALSPGVEKKKFNAFIQYFQQSGGFFDDNNVAPPQPPPGETAPSPEEMEEFIEEQLTRWVALKDFLDEHQLTDEVDIKPMSDGLLITLSDSLTFESGSAQLLPRAQKLLARISESLANDVVEIEVQGHTDNVPISGNGLYKSNWYLGGARAVSVVEYLQQNAKVDPKRFKASSYGEYKPVADNDSPEGRRKNRRVEIYLRDKIQKSEPKDLIGFPSVEEPEE